MKKRFAKTVLFLLLIATAIPVLGQDGTVPAFKFEPCAIQLSRPARPLTTFDKVGRKFAVLGFESGSFEAWAYPLKLFRNFEFSFLIGSSTVPVQGRDIVRFIDVTPARTTLTYAYQSFTIKAHFVTVVDEPGAFILLEVDSTEPLTIVCSLLPVLQPMWPAGLGGQYAYWDDELKAYLISEPMRRNHGVIGSPAARGISYTPAHMLSDVPNQFKIAVEVPRAVKGKYLPIIMTGGRGNREDVKQTYKKLAASPEAFCRAAEKHYKELLAATLRVKTPNKELDLAFAWAKVAIDNLLVDNPDLGKGLVAGLGPSGTGGRPGFGWFFGSDAYINSLSLNSMGHTMASKDALAFTRKWQREDGKMAHELSQAAGTLNWWKDYPYGYIHGDTTPYYIVAMDDYYSMTGDADFVRKSWPSLKKAYAWCLTTDEDADGLMDNSKAGLGALEFGALTGIRTDIYLAAVWIKACESIQRLAGAMGDPDLVKRAKKDHARALDAFREKLWDGENGQYSYAFNGNGDLVHELTPWSAVGLMWSLGTPERSASTLERLGSADLTTDWGVRMLSVKSPLFEPLNYNYGAAWPFLTSWVALAQFKHDFLVQGYNSLMTSVRHTFDNGLGCVTEVFSGAQNIWPQEAVAHQGFCSAGVVLPFVRGLLGLEGNAPGKRIVFGPRFPADWNEVGIENFRVGEETISIGYERRDGEIEVTVGSENKAGFQMMFSPAMGLGTKVLRARVNGKPAEIEAGQGLSFQAVRPAVEFPLTGKDTIVLEFEPSVEVLPPPVRTRTGDADRGLKIIRTELAGNKLRVVVEGLSGEIYDLPITNAVRVVSARGAELDGGTLVIRIPDKPEGGFVRHEIVLELKKDAE
ncbi:MAG: GH116 family glycosyl hydrolase [Candidatus Aminicenantes bacterium]|nr:GH116 family glycosyl hydrolase [Candidatus Aminicenantes bacterium]